MSLKNRVFQLNGTLVSVSQVAAATPYSAEFLRKLARSGKIDAQKIGRDWLTTYESVLGFIRSQQQRHERKLDALREAERSFNEPSS